jgi:cobalamin synthase
MKAPDLGPLGMAAVVLSLLVQVAALAACTAAGEVPWRWSSRRSPAGWP